MSLSTTSATSAPPLSADAIPGYGALFQSGPPSNAAASEQAQAAQNPYQQAYSQSIAASDSALILAAANSGSVLPWQDSSYALQASGNVLSQTSSTLSALQQGLAAGFFSGTGIDTLA
ncbi:MAG: hypothetical protein ACYDGM_05090 [Vulcanimicrobiaceae bacterium]